MAAHSKQRTTQHLIDSDAQDLLKASLPKHWVLHEYRPDYGLDFAIEPFKGPIKSGNHGTSFETLGEHLFIQLKGRNRVRRRRNRLYARYNVEKVALREHRENIVGEIEVIPLVLEVSELLTVQRMGAAQPVLLVVADLETQRCFFVCLNDYIDKVLLPRHSDYTRTAKRTIHIPTSNVLASPDGLAAFRWYAKRPKLFAAFQKFIYQEHELRYATGPELAKHFNLCG